MAFGYASMMGVSNALNEQRKQKQSEAARQQELADQIALMKEREAISSPDLSDIKMTEIGGLKIYHDSKGNIIHKEQPTQEQGPEWETMVQPDGTIIQKSRKTGKLDVVMRPYVGGRSGGRSGGGGSRSGFSGSTGKDGKPTGEYKYWKWEPSDTMTAKGARSWGLVPKLDRYGRISEKAQEEAARHGINMPAKVPAAKVVNKQYRELKIGLSRMVKDQDSESAGAKRVAELISNAIGAPITSREIVDMTPRQMAELRKALVMAYYPKAEQKPITSKSGGGKTRKVGGLLIED